MVGPGFGSRGSLVPNKELRWGNKNPEGFRESLAEGVILELRWMDGKQPWDGGVEQGLGRKNHRCQGLKSEKIMACLRKSKKASMVQDKTQKAGRGQVTLKLILSAVGSC